MTVSKAKAIQDNLPVETNPLAGKVNPLEMQLITANQNREYLDRCRYWATEFEHPQAGNKAHFLEHLKNTASNDSTVPTGAPNCDCLECGHKCDCRSCNERFKTCNFAGQNEVTTVPSPKQWDSALTRYIKALDETGETPENYEQAPDDYCENCDENREYCGCDWEENNWGFHTHIDARDLDLRRVASVMRLATLLMVRFADAFGEDNYNSHAYIRDIDEFADSGHWSGGRTAVNPMGIVNYLHNTHESDREWEGKPSDRQKATIEFRSFRFTGVPELHRARVAFARAVVDYVVAGKPLFYLARETNFALVLEDLEIHKH